MSNFNTKRHLDINRNWNFNRYWYIHGNMLCYFYRYWYTNRDRIFHDNFIRDFNSNIVNHFDWYRYIHRYCHRDVN